MARHLFFQLGSQSSISEQEISTMFSVESEHISSFTFLEYSLPHAKKRFFEMGGVIRMGEILGESSSWKKIESQIQSFLLSKTEEGKKMRVGLFFSGKNGWKKKGIDVQKSLKSTFKSQGKSLRIVNRRSENLDTFAVTKEKLTEKGHSEICIIAFPSGWAWGRTTAVQNASEFVFRDIKKPIRDMQVGMLPPKLARIMINLSRAPEGHLPEKIYDPFCGTGTVLLEALSLGVRITGSDLSEKMITATKKNTQWYYRAENPDADKRSPFFISDIFVKDATHPFSPQEQRKVSNSTIVAEGFLGKIFSSPLTFKMYTAQKEQLFPLYRQMIYQVSNTNISKIVFGFPFWRGKKEEEYFSFVPELTDFAQKLGWKETISPLRYLREEQVVGREIVVWEKS